MIMLSPWAPKHHLAVRQSGPAERTLPTYHSSGRRLLQRCSLLQTLVVLHHMKNDRINLGFWASLHKRNERHWGTMRSMRDYLSCLKLLKVAYLPVVGKFRAKPNSIHHRYDRPLFCSTKVRKWFLPLSCLATFGHHWLDTPSIYARRAWLWSALLWVHNNNNHIIDIYYIYIIDIYIIDIYS